MDMLNLNGADTKLYMRFDKAWHRAAQGMGVWEDRAYVLYDTGACAVYDLVTRDAKPLDVFKLGSYREPEYQGDPYHNHANDCMFSKTHFEGNPIPLLYVTIGTGIGTDEDGYFYRIKVENITSTVDEAGNESYRGKVLQTVVVRPEGDPERGFRDPGWGCPCHVLDAEGGFIYTVSARYRTTRGSLPEGKTNALIITKYPVPEVVEGSTVRLAGKDILDTEDFLVSTLLLPLGAIVYLIFCVTRFGWGFDNYLEECNTGKGIKMPRAFRHYFRFVLPVLILVILVSGLWGIFFPAK